MKITIAKDKLKEFLKRLESVENTATESPIKLTKEGMSITTTDPASISMINLEIKAGFFVEYDIKQEFSMKVHIGDLNKCLKSYNENVSICIENENADRITLKNSTGKKQYELKLIDVTLQETKMPDFNNKSFGVVFSMDSEAFYKNISDVEHNFEVVLITRDGAEIKFESPDEQTGTLCKYFNKSNFGEDTIKIISDNSDVRVRFNASILSKFARTLSKGDAIVSIGTDYPIVIKQEEQNVSTMLIVAPRVDSD